MTGRVRVVATLTIVVSLCTALLSVAVESAGAAPAVTGAGSTWAQIPIDQWRADIAHEGFAVNYQGVGDAAGRSYYSHDQVDFAATMLPFSASEQAGAAHRPYSYVPLVAGTTAFMFHLDSNGQRLVDLQLGPETLAEIFTGEITNWNDPRIRADTGRALPSLRIVPVLSAAGDDVTTIVTDWFATAAPAAWARYCARVGLSPCGATSSIEPTGAAVVEVGPDSVAGYVAAPSSNGAITYVGRTYATERGFPVASVRNASGRYMQPTIGSAIAALSAARTDAAGAPQLHDVFTSPAWNAYPLADYASAIVPRTVAAPFTKAKGETLGRFLTYAVCAGQRKSNAFGNPALPRVLVKLALRHIGEIPGAPAPPSVADCIPSDSALPRITPGTAVVTEGNAGTQIVRIPFALSSAASSPVIADWTTYVPAAGAPWAQTPSDYDAAHGTLSFAAGQTTASVSLVVHGDGVKEPDELIIVSLLDATGAAIGGVWGLAIATIHDDD